ncbi:uncharacterized protein [Choristoneura fumiferana]|uniref:uncharacterized protein n=1 Tax=Choristoneura fumiferana TaxID=7141 RepID=UPI003D15BC0F
MARRGGTMPALWQSSQRPMYVRTVWVDGFRHALLTNDDPYYAKLKKRRPHSSASTTQYTKTRTRREDSDLRKLSLVITSDKSSFGIRPKSHPDIEELNLNDLDQESEDEFLLKANSQPIYEFDSSRSKYNSLCLNMKAFRSNRTARNDCKENTDLSDRVLQWLDLAGKIDLLAPENGERMSQPRHSWPEIQKRNHNLSKSKTTIDLRAKEEAKTPKTDSARTQQSGIDRHDYHVPTSAATIENYARQSRNKITLRDAPKTKDAKTKRDIRVNVLEARQKVATERSAVEKQYAELVSKKLIPDLAKGKKQVHIFMPEMPKKHNSSVTSRTESLLSQLSSLNKF